MLQRGTEDAAEHRSFHLRVIASRLLEMLRKCVPAAFNDLPYKALPSEVFTSCNDLLITEAASGGLVQTPADSPGIERFHIVVQLRIGHYVDIDFTAIRGNHSTPCAVDEVLDSAARDAFSGKLTPRTDYGLQIGDADDWEEVVDQASADFTQGSHEALDGRDWRRIQEHASQYGTCCAVLGKGDHPGGNDRCADPVTGLGPGRRPISGQQTTLDTVGR